MSNLSWRNERIVRDFRWSIIPEDLSNMEKTHNLREETYLVLGRLAIHRPMINRPRINHPDPRRSVLGARGPLSHKVFPVLRALLRVGQGLLVDLGGLHDVLRMFTDLVDVANVLGDVCWRVVLNFAHNAKTFRRSKRGLKNLVEIYVKSERNLY